LPAGIDSRFSIKDGVRFQAELQARAVDPGVVFEDFPGSLDVQATIAGSVTNEQFTADLTIDTIEGLLKSHPLQMSGNARLKEGYLEIPELAVKSGESLLIVTGRIDGEYDLSYSLAVPDLAALDSRGAGEIRLEGNIMGDLLRPRIEAALTGEHIAVNDFSVSSVEAELVLVASTDGNISADARLDARLKGVSLQDRLLDRVEINITGGPDSHRIELKALQDTMSLFAAVDGSLVEKSWHGKVDTLNFSHPQKGKIGLVDQARIVAGPDRVTLDTLCLSHDAAMMCLQGGLEESQWQAEVSLKGVDPGYFFASRSGRIDAQLSGYGDLSSSTHHIEIADFSGVLQDKPVGGVGSVEIDGESIAVNGLNLQYGDALLKADGTIDKDEYDLHFTAEVPDLQELMPELEGRLALSGGLSGDRRMPVLQLDFAGHDGKMADFSFAAIKGQVAVDLHHDGIIDVKIQGKNIESSKLEIMEASLEAVGTTAAHTFEIRAVTNLGSGVARGRGGYDSSWKGGVETARFTLEEYGDWSLTQTALIEIGKEKYHVKDLCLQGERADLCLSGSMEEKAWSIQSSTTALPLSLLNDFGLIDFPVQGEMQATLVGEGEQGKITRLDGSLKIPELLFTDDGPNGGLTYTFSENRLDTEIRDDSLFIDLHSNFENSGEVTGQLNIKNFSGDTAALVTLPLDGRLDFYSDDLSFVTIMSNSRILPSGNLQGNLELNGTLKNPKIQGEIDLEQGEIHLTDLGITLKEVSAKITSERESIIAVVTAQSGPGNVRAEGELSFAPDKRWKLTSQVSGTNVEIMATKSYVIQASPDVRLNLSEEGNIVSGKLDIPYARITPGGSSGVVTASSDVVVVDLPEKKPRSDNLFVIDLDLILGDDVHIDAYGLKSRLEGGIDLHDAPGRILSASGELVVKEGEFSFYSVELDIVRGRLLFSGESVDNPGVDFRARRKVEKNVVGVVVSGTAQDPEFQLFSDPAMEESNILAYLLVGKSMYASTDNDQSLVGAAATALGIRGVNTITGKLDKYVPVDEIYLDGSTGSEDMSIVVGKNITEDLFIGYDHNFFDSSGEFKVRYNLGKNFSLETRSSANSTSGDFLYSIEK
jgi:translocation and assembly module TamB